MSRKGGAVGKIRVRVHCKLGEANHFDSDAWCNFLTASLCLVGIGSHHDDILHDYTQSKRAIDTRGGRPMLQSEVDVGYANLQISQDLGCHSPNKGVFAVSSWKLCGGVSQFRPVEKPLLDSSSLC
jgi:hypothetical protein